jgi:hypothetical protein
MRSLSRNIIRKLEGFIAGRGNPRYKSLKKEANKKCSLNHSECGYKLSSATTILNDEWNVNLRPTAEKK